MEFVDVLGLTAQYAMHCMPPKTSSQMVHKQMQSRSAGHITGMMNTSHKPAAIKNTMPLTNNLARKKRVRTSMLPPKVAMVVATSARIPDLSLHSIANHAVVFWLFTFLPFSAHIQTRLEGTANFEAARMRETCGMLEHSTGCHAPACSLSEGSSHDRKNRESL
jgi:hypothetical protein